MGAAAEELAEVAGDATDIGARAAVNGKAHEREVNGDVIDGENLNGPWFNINNLTLTCQIIGALTVDV